MKLFTKIPVNENFIYPRLRSLERNLGFFLFVMVFVCGFQSHAGTEINKGPAASLTSASAGAYCARIIPTIYCGGSTDAVTWLTNF